MTLDHDPNNAIITPTNLFPYIGQDLGLTAVIFAAVGMAGIDHDSRTQPGVLHFFTGFINALCIVVWLGATTQNDMAIFIAQRRHNGRMPPFGHRQKMMRMRSGLDRIDCDPHAAPGTVFETTGPEQTRTNSTLNLTFRV